ncbi:tape measure protein [Spartinivicinus ruber]|uniref:tape measure protein n=1 Tax=Spartinivicinus ruber TaxID=2683272 RepID=UPI0013D2FE51|nr:tape measure protein [Spartinivicinus ruber]
MTTAAQLQIAVETTGVNTATSVLQQLAIQGQRSERATDGLTDAIRDLVRQGRLTEQAVNRLGVSLDRLEGDTQDAARATDGLANSFSRVKGVLSAIAGSMAIREVVQAADAFAKMQAQLDLVSSSASEARQSYSALFDLAQESRADIEATVGLYSKLARSTKEMSLSNEQLLAITETVNKSFKISGASAEEAKYSIIQLGQGLASGVLRGDEFNSVMENAPRLARAMADELNLTTGELRALAQEGKLTSKVVAGSILNQANAIREEYKKIPRTVGDALTQLKNDFTNAFGRTDVTPLTSAIDDLRKLIADEGFQQSVVALGTAITKVIGAAGEGLSELVDLGRQIGTLAAKASGSTDEIEDLRQAITRLQTLQNSSDLSRTGIFYIDGEFDLHLDQQEIAEALENKKTQLNELLKKYGFSPEYDDSGAKIKPNKAEGKIDVSFSVSGNLEAVQKRIAALNEEASTLGMTARAIDIYKASQQEATKADLKAINAAYDKIEAYQNQQKFDALAQSLRTEEELIKDNYKTSLEIVRNNTTATAELRQRLTGRVTAEYHKELAALKKQKADEIQTIKDSLATEEELILSSYDKRLNQILEKTRTGSKLQQDLLERLNKKFATNVLDGFRSSPKSTDEKIADLEDEYKRAQNVVLKRTQITEEEKTKLLVQLAEERQKRLEEIEKNSEVNKVRNALKTEPERATDLFQERLKTIDESGESEEEKDSLRGRATKQYATDVLGDFAKEQTIEEKINKINEDAEKTREAILANEALTQEQQTELVSELTKQRNEQVQQLNDQKNQQMLATSGKFFDGMAGLAKAYAGEQSGIYRALFAVSKAHALAEALLEAKSLYMKAAASAPPPANAVPIALAVAQGAAGVAQVAAVNFSGAYDKGGHIPAGKFGLVGEYGPEFVNGPANVTSRKDTTKMLEQASQKAEATPPPQVNVRVVNAVDPAIVGDFLDTHEGEQLIMNVVRRNQGALS